MDKGTAIREIKAWPIEDRIELVREVWDSIVDSGWEPELSEELKAELDRRIAHADSNPDDVVTWEET